MKTKRQPLSIYIHIPFCVKKCLYCDFLSGPAGEETKERYVNCLVNEIEREADKYSAYEVMTVFVGGGTPSLLDAEDLELILKSLMKCFRVAEQNEITIEVNPGTVSQAKLEAYRRMGINRLSIGLQSAHNEELMGLGRIHTFEDFQNTYQSAVKSGFNNINIDLMSAIPGQTVESYRRTLDEVLALLPPPPHISSYSLIIEEGTPFYDNTPILPDEEADREMYKITSDILCDKGYRRYEISNYAKEGFACKHNKVYWRRGDYVGFGVGAASLVANVRFHNVRELDRYLFEMELSERDEDYIPSIKEDVQILSPEEQMEEYMFLGLRMTEGVCREDFWETFQRSIDEVYPGLVDKFCRMGLLQCRQEKASGKEYIALTERGLDVSNIVMAEFLLSDEDTD